MVPNSVLDEIKLKCRAKGTNRVFVQLPEGLKVHAKQICRDLEGFGFVPILGGDRCFGACDVKTIQDAVTLHVGHSKMLDLPWVVYWEYRSDTDPWQAIKEIVDMVTEKRIGLATTVQHIGFLQRIKEKLEGFGKEVLIGRGYRATYPGQVLGCDVEGCKEISEAVEAFLFFGTGTFHPQAIAYVTRKKVYAIDPFTREVQVVTWEIFEKERALRITKAMDAKAFGVVISTKPGQTDWSSAEKIATQLKEDGKEACFIVVDEVNPELLDYLPYDAYVITACPRIVIDDWKNYKKPILLPSEAEALISE